MTGGGLEMKCKYEGSGVCIGTRGLDPCRGYESCKNYSPDCKQDGGDGEYRQCPYNKGVDCRATVCSKCGWNPQEAERRKGALKNGISCLLSTAAAENERC